MGTKHNSARARALLVITVFVVAAKREAVAVQARIVLVLCCNGTRLGNCKRGVVQVLADTQVVPATLSNRGAVRSRCRTDQARAGADPQAIWGRSGVDVAPPHARTSDGHMCEPTRMSISQLPRRSSVLPRSPHESGESRFVHTFRARIGFRGFVPLLLGGRRPRARVALLPTEFRRFVSIPWGFP